MLLMGIILLIADVLALLSISEMIVCLVIQLVLSAGTMVLINVKCALMATIYNTTTNVEIVVRKDI